LRTREAEAEIEKWDAWHACAGLSRTAAKRQYISTLIDTMKEYASGTAESRELVSELEFVWNQIRSQSGSSEDEGSGGSGGERERESPTRKLERAGLKGLGSLASIPPGRATDDRGGGGDGGGEENRMRVLSPVSQRDSDDIVEGEEIDANPGAMVRRPASPPPHGGGDWRTRIEFHLRHLSTEVAALREQLSSNNLLSSSSLSPHLTSRRRRILFRAINWIRWIGWFALRQLLVDAVLVGMFIAWARWRGYKDRRVEEWVKRRWRDLRRLLEDGGTWARRMGGSRLFRYSS
jgi:DNA-binding transcriptional ArsR family regulator